MRNMCAATSFRGCVYGSCFLLHLLVFSKAAATILSSLALGSSLSSNQFLQSANATFKFGFFSLPPRSSSMYLGIWYADIVPFTSVWVANRNKAVSQNATCVFDHSGRVNLFEGGKTVWSIGESASLLLLLETGNLVLQSSNSSVIWQSFDHPGNTWLPTMVLGPGKKLKSWLAPDDPSPGHYTVMMGDSDNFICMYNNSTQYYDSGHWDGEKFSNVPEMQNNYIFSFSYNRSGFQWETARGFENFKISRFVIEYSGFMIQSSYQVSYQSWSAFWEKPNNPCDVERMCGRNSICDNRQQPNCKCPATGFQPVDKQEWGANIFTHGCERNSPLNCTLSHGSNDGFISLNQTSFEWSFFYSLPMADLQKCKDLCLANCSCNGFFFNGDVHGNCSLFSEDLYDGTMSSSATGMFYMRVSAVDLLSYKLASRKKSKFGCLQIGLLVGGIVILVVTSLVVLLVVRRWKPTAGGGQSEAGLKAFSYAELQAATKNFKHKLGSGGFGTVYGGLTGDLVFAVKKLNNVEECEKQFRAEVRTIGTIQHINLVRLLGFCSEGKHRLLVYEMAENGSLDAHLFRDDARAAALTWRLRHHIALGAARAIAYLHESCRERIIHCDIKPENILLDVSYNAKVADFGLAKLLGREFSHVLTTLRGTRGYLAPEWIAGMPITSKADVYSFGMTLLELISGHRNVHNDPLFASTAAHCSFFPVRVAQHVRKPSIDLASLLDARIQGDVDMEQLTRMAHCAIWCIQDHEDSRPSMGDVVKILEGSMAVSLPPIPKLLQCLVEN